MKKHYNVTIKQYHRGFTLIEMLVTVGILVLILAAAIPSYNKYRSSNEMIQVANTLKTAVLSAKNYALSPSLNKQAGYDWLWIRFYSQSRQYVIEDPKNIYESQSFSANDYDLSFSNGLPMLQINFQISQGGKMYLPDGSTSPQIITLTGKKVNGPNKVDIIVDPQSGLVTISQPHN